MIKEILLNVISLGEYTLLKDQVKSLEFTVMLLEDERDWDREELNKLKEEISLLKNEIHELEIDNAILEEELEKYRPTPSTGFRYKWTFPTI